MEKREKYKHLLMFLASTLIMAIQIGVFAYMWYHHFEKNMLRHYWHRGNYVIIAQYALLLFLFYKKSGCRGFRPCISHPPSVIPCPSDRPSFFSMFSSTSTSEAMSSASF